MRRWFSVFSVLLIAVFVLSSCAVAAPATPTAGVATPPVVETPITGLTPTVGLTGTAEVTGTLPITGTPAVGGTALVTGTAVVTGTLAITGTPIVTGTPAVGAVGEEAVAAALGEVPDLAGQRVSVLAVWGGDELESFRAMVAPWEQATGATIEYEGTRDINAVLTTRVQGGNPPDIAGLPGPGALAEYARAGNLIDLRTFFTEADLQPYPETWINVASYQDGLYGIFTKGAVKSLVWYRPSVFQQAGYQAPQTWDEMIALSDQIVQAGGTPWCLGLESAATSGWPGTDWIEDIMLRTAGPEVYDQWWQHEIPWTDPAVKRAWELFGQIATREQYVNGGIPGSLATNFGESPFPMFEAPPGCYMHRQANFITSFIQAQFPNETAGETYTFFRFPVIEEQFGTPVLSGGDLIGMFNDTPGARSLMRWLNSAQAQEIWSRRGGFISLNNNVDPSVYPDAITREAVTFLQEADVVRFDASDLMPAAVDDAFRAGILQYVQDPGSLDAVLQNIETIAQDAYTQQ